MSYSEMVDEKKLAKIMRRMHAKMERERRETIREIRRLEKSLVELR